MPIVTISILEGSTAEYKNSIHEAVHSALVNVFKIPEGDYNQKINEYGRAYWKIPEGKSDKFITIEIIAFPGRKKETKKKLYQEIIFNLEKIGIDKNDTFIIVIEQPMENWGIRGGIPADEVDVGFKTDV